ncbi:hypothetical protein [Streptomyces sp. NPDC056817]|uniref:hypothetical protein n=1 Tax=Streptomyces sp. NPDC056817 TaxID=3345950 RepID=UPI0036BA4BB3
MDRTTRGPLRTGRRRDSAGSAGEVLGGDRGPGPAQVASLEGVGYQIIVAYSTFSAGAVFAAVILIAVASTFLYGGLVLIERVLLRWRPRVGKPAV